MLKERVGAEQLADMIARKINVAGVEIAVRKDHAFGWTPTVLSALSWRYRISKASRGNRSISEGPI
jgi:hypothetical protein